MNILEVANKAKQDKKVKTENTVKMFEAIKDECLNSILSNGAKSNYEFKSSLHSWDLVDIIIKQGGFSIPLGCLDVFCHFSAGWFPFVYINNHYIDCLKITKRNDNLTSDVLNAWEFLNKYDLCELTLLLYKYFKSKGMKCEVKHTIIGNHKTKLFNYRITRKQAEKLLNGENINKFFFF